MKGWLSLIPIAIPWKRYSIFSPVVNVQWGRKIVEGHSIISLWQRQDLNPELPDFMEFLCSRLFRQLRKCASIQEQFKRFCFQVTEYPNIRVQKKKKKRKIYHPHENRATIGLIFWWFNDNIKETNSFQHFALDIGCGLCPHLYISDRKPMVSAVE